MKTANKMKRFFTSCFGLGLLPIAPGTWGSLPVILIFALMCRFGASVASVSITMFFLALAGTVICVKFAPAVIAATAKADPGEINADELAGQAVTFLLILTSPRLLGLLPSYGIFVITLLGFILFRLFDILKPWPINRLEKLPQGWGIIADDLLAGVYAGIVLLFSLRCGLIGCISKCFSAGSSSLNVPSAIFLGIIQGLTEFLPVSSSGHLVLLENLLHFNAERPEMLLFDLTIHVGTLVAIFIVFSKSISAFLKNLAASGKYGTTAPQIYKKSPSVRFIVLAVTATAVTGVLGAIFEHYFKSARGSLPTVALMWTINGTLLLITDRREKTRLGLRSFGIKEAAIIGLAQAVAIMPGISRSGSTICTALLLGLNRRWAVEFSFLIAIPAILGATAVELLKNFSQIDLSILPVSSVIAGSITSALTGILALKLLIKALKTAKLKLFALYCYILALFTAIYLLSKPW